MNDSIPNTRPSLAVTAVWLLVLSVLIAAFWFVVFTYMPMQKKKFDEFALQLPSMTMFAIDLAMLLSDAWFVALPVMLVVVPGGFVILRHGFDAAKGGILYALMIATLLSATIGFFLVSILIPLRKLAEALSK